MIPFSRATGRQSQLLVLCLLLGACSAQGTGHPSAVSRTETKHPAVAAVTVPRIAYQAKPVPYALIEQIKSETGEQKLSVKITYPVPEAFRTQAFNCGEVAAASVQVTGPGLSQPIYADGSDAVNHRISANSCSISAVLSNVPYGELIATIRLYDTGGEFLTGSELKGALRLNSHNQTLELSYRQMLAGNLLEKLMQGPIEDRFLAGQIDLVALQALLDNLMQVGGNFPNYTFVQHPSLINLPALINDLKASNGDVSALNPANPAYHWTPGRARIVVDGYLAPQPIEISVDDTLSQNLQVNANGEVLISDLPPGTWTIRISGPGYLPERIPVTITPNGLTDLGTIGIKPPQPTLTAIVPAQGVAGESMTLTGTNFNTSALANNKVFFGSVAATVSAATATSLTVTVPAGLTGTTQAVTVRVGSSNPSNSLSFNLLRPIINNLTPAFGSVGASIVLNGSHFNPTLANNTVRFGSTPATVTAATATSLTVTVPAGLTGTVGVTAQNLLSAFSEPVNFAVTPTLTAATPNNGSLNDSIVLSGTGFSSTLSNNTVRFGGVSATVTAATPTSLTVQMPDVTAGTRNITVQVGTQTSGNIGFLVLPRLISLNADATIGGKAALIRGQTLTLNGTHFDPTASNNTVMFGAISALAATANPAGTQLTVIVPAGVDVPGDVAVSVVSNSQTSNSLTAAVPGVNVTINGGFK